jgi:hypothetical protein
MGLCLLALAPRLCSLSTFLTADELPWIENSIRFLSALGRGDWLGTFRFGVGAPGGIADWAGAVGIATYYLVHRPAGSLEEFLARLLARPGHVLAVLSAVRLPIVLVAVGGLVGIYLLAGRLFGRRVALLAALLLAFDPLYLAHSRFITMDTLLTVFMTLSLLSFLVYVERGPAFRYLVFSGLCGGLAFASKASGLFVAFFVALLAVFFAARRGSLPSGIGRTVLALALWGLMAGLALFLAWPAMWVKPLDVLRQVFEGTFALARGGVRVYFWGLSTVDPGPWFYLLFFLFRLTPLALAGLAASLLVWRRESRVLIWLWAYVLLFFLFLAASATKQERYILPVFPVVNILTAAGLSKLFRVASSRFKLVATESTEFTEGKARSGFETGVLVGCLALQVGFVLPHHPYYLTYYNPMFGGGQAAAQAVMVGWGEGLEGAARYLNSKEGAASLKAASPYGETVFEPFFVGQRRAFSRRSLFWNDVDYLVFYINQVQRRLPDPELVAYFHPLEPEHVVRLKGLDYAWVYRVPRPLPTELVPNQGAERVAFDNNVLFLGYERDTGRVRSEGVLGVDLYWQALRQMDEDYTVYLKLVNGAYHVWGQQAGRPAWGSYPTNRWREGKIVGDRREIKIWPGTPPGYYHVSVILYDLHGEQGLEPELLLGPLEIPQQEGLTVEDLDIGRRLEANLGDRFRLLGYNIESGFRPGDAIHLTLFWQALAGVDEDYAVFTHLMDDQGKLWGQKDNQPVDGFYPTTQWVSGQFVRDQYDLLISPDAPPGQYRIEVGMYLADSGERLAVLDENGLAVDDKIVLPALEVLR